MHGDLECPGRSPSAGTIAPGPPEPGPRQHSRRKLEQRTTGAPCGRSSYFTCGVAVARDNGTVADLQAYLKLFCRRRALIEVGDHGLAVHFEAADEAEVFSGLWTAWAAAGLVPTSRCRHLDGLDQLKLERMGAMRR